MKTVTLFENQSLRTGTNFDGEAFSHKDLQELLNFTGDSVPYFTLKKNGVHFHDFAGIIQTENLRIEVLPRADRSFAGPDEKGIWRKIFIQMLAVTGIISGRPQNISSKALKSDSLPDLLFETFIRETEYILHNGLIRQYRLSEGSSGSLRGRLVFGKNIQKNSVHHEKLYTKKTEYDNVNLLNIIVHKALLTVKRLNTGTELSGRTGTLLLNFPEMPDMRISSQTFEKISFSRKNIHYKNCIETAKLILLNDHSDRKKGKNSGFALMTELNDLWKKFIYKSMLKYRKRDFSITVRTAGSLWKSEYSDRKKIKPDIILNKGSENCIVLDTKWKNSPSSEDFRRLHSASEIFGSDKTAFLLPGEKSLNGFFLNSRQGRQSEKICRIIRIPADINVEQWRKNISSSVDEWMD